MSLKTTISTADEKAVFYEKEGSGGISTTGTDKVLIMKYGIGESYTAEVFKLVTSSFF